MVLWLRHCVVVAVTRVRILVRAFLQLFLAVGTSINMHILQISEPGKRFLLLNNNACLKAARNGSLRKNVCDFESQIRSELGLASKFTGSPDALYVEFI